MCVKMSSRGSQKKVRILSHALLPLKNLLRSEWNYDIHDGKCANMHNSYCWVKPYNFNDHV